MVQAICIKDKRIKVIITWPEFHSIGNTQVFIIFANFYCRFIKGFNKIAILPISILKTIISTLSANIRKFIRDDKNNNNEQSRGDITSRVIGGSDGKIENLPKAKIIQKSNKFKKLDFIKTNKPDSTNKAFGIDFLIPNT